MSAVVSAVSSVFSAVGDAVGTVVKAAEDVVHTVVDDVVKPVAKAVENTVQAAINDPIGTIAKVAAVATGQIELLPLINAADVAAHGGSLTDVVKGAAISYASAGVGDFVGSELGAADLGDTATGIAKNAASGAAGAALRGGDITQGAIAGGLNYGVNSAIDQGASAINRDLNAPSSSDTSPLSFKLPESVTGNEMSSGDTSSTDTSGNDTFDLEAIKQHADDAMKPVDYSLSADPSKSYSELTMDSIRGMAPGLNSMNGAQGLVVDVNSPLGDPNSFINDPAYRSGKEGVISAAGFTDKNALPALGDPKSFINDPNVTGQPITPTPSCAYDVNVPNINVASLLNSQRKQNALGMAFGDMDMNVPWLNTKTQMLRNDKIYGNANGQGGASSPELTHIYDNLNPDLAKEFSDRGISGPSATSMPSTPSLMDNLNSAARGMHLPSLGFAGLGFKDGGNVSHFACGGTGTSTTCATWGAMGQFMPKFQPVTSGMLSGAGGRRQPPTLAQLKQLQSHISSGGNMGGMASGGLPSKYHEAMPRGHNPEFVTGLTGYYACGGGTGQSDDIPAMLHDGDYVMDAEAVSALGDGSSKAGREILDGFRTKVPHKDTAGGKPVPAKIADGEYVFPAGFVTALGGGDNKRGAHILDGLREKLRAHKRSAPDSKIPPKAKSPLDYIKGSKG